MSKFRHVPALILCAFLGACGNEDEDDDLPSPEPSQPAAYYCQEWPEAAAYCDGPTLSAEDAFARLDKDELEGERRLVAIQSSNGGGLAPDGQQLLTGDGWGFLYDRANGTVEWLHVRAEPVGPTLAPTSCEVGSIRVDGMTRQIQAAAELLRADYGLTFEPDTFSLFAAREASCQSRSGLSRTIVEAKLKSPNRDVTVEFDERGALVGACEVGGQLRGCR